METILKHQSKQYIIKRYPETKDTALRAWSNAELLAFDFIKDKNHTHFHLYNDRFGVWNCLLKQKTTSVLTYASQKKAIIQNLKLNNLPTNFESKTPLEKLDPIEIALIKIPKSLDLFELFLQQIHKNSSKQSEVVCCFMTKYFSSAYLKIAGLYFEEVSQSLAWKKARLLILKKPKKLNNYKSLIKTINYNKSIINQYFGVFSADKIDIGTQYLLNNFSLKDNETTILDLACGNGIIAQQLAYKKPELKISLIDDFNLAIASAKINLKDNQATSFICDNNLSLLQKEHFDLVISNPPFHFEHENNIEISLTLFEEVTKILKPKGRFVLVANTHLNYQTHLTKLFKTVSIVNSNNKFVIYSCKQ